MYNGIFYLNSGEKNYKYYFQNNRTTYISSSYMGLPSNIRAPGVLSPTLASGKCLIKRERGQQAWGEYVFRVLSQPLAICITSTYKLEI